MEQQLVNTHTAHTIPMESDDMTDSLDIPLNEETGGRKRKKADDGTPEMMEDNLVLRFKTKFAVCEAKTRTFKTALIKLNGMCNMQREQILRLEMQLELSKTSEEFLKKLECELKAENQKLVEANDTLTNENKKLLDERKQLLDGLIDNFSNVSIDEDLDFIKKFEDGSLDEMEIMDEIEAAERRIEERYL